MASNSSSPSTYQSGPTSVSTASSSFSFEEAQWDNLDVRLNLNLDFPTISPHTFVITPSGASRQFPPPAPTPPASALIAPWFKHIQNQRLGSPGGFQYQCSPLIFPLSAGFEDGFAGHDMVDEKDEQMVDVEGEDTTSSGLFFSHMWTGADDMWEEEYTNPEAAIVGPVHDQDNYGSSRSKQVARRHYAASVC